MASSSSAVAPMETDSGAAGEPDEASVRISLCPSVDNPEAQPPTASHTLPTTSHHPTQASLAIREHSCWFGRAALTPTLATPAVQASNPYTEPLRQLCDAKLLRPEPRQCASEKNLKNAVNAELPDDFEHRLTNINGGRRPTGAAKLAQLDRRARWWAEALRGVCGVDATQTSAHDHECGVHGQGHLPGWAFGEQARAAIPLFRFSPLFLRCPLPSQLLPLSCVALAGRVRWGQEAKGGGRAGGGAAG